MQKLQCFIRTVALLNQGHNFVNNDNLCNYKDYIESVRNGFTQSPELSVLLAHQLLLFLYSFYKQFLYQFIIKLDYDLPLNSAEIKNIWTLIIDAKH